MARLKDSQTTDPDVLAILNVLESHKALHPRSKIDAYRYNSASIRIRVVDSDFQKMDRSIRHDQIWGLLGRLPEDIQSQITLLLLLTPRAVKTSLANLEFEDPMPSRL